jgi:hypothetical protein
LAHAVKAWDDGETLTVISLYSGNIEDDREYRLHVAVIEVMRRLADVDSLKMLTGAARAQHFSNALDAAIAEHPELHEITGAEGVAIINLYKLYKSQGWYNAIMSVEEERRINIYNRGM